jgi:hypothetical protein
MNFFKHSKIKSLGFLLLTLLWSEHALGSRRVPTGVTSNNNGNKSNVPTTQSQNVGNKSQNVGNNKPPFFKPESLIQRGFGGDNYSDPSNNSNVPTTQSQNVDNKSQNVGNNNKPEALIKGGFGGDNNSDPSNNSNVPTTQSKNVDNKSQNVGNNNKPEALIKGGFGGYNNSGPSNNKSNVPTTQSQSVGNNNKPEALIKEGFGGYNNSGPSNNNAYQPQNNYNLGYFPSRENYGMNQFKGGFGGYNNSGPSNNNAYYPQNSFPSRETSGMNDFQQKKGQFVSFAPSMKAGSSYMSNTFGARQSDQNQDESNAYYPQNNYNSGYFPSRETSGMNQSFVNRGEPLIQGGFGGDNYSGPSNNNAYYPQNNYNRGYFPSGEISDMNLFQQNRVQSSVPNYSNQISYRPYPPSSSQELEQMQSEYKKVMEENQKIKEELAYLNKNNPNNSTQSNINNSQLLPPPPINNSQLLPPPPPPPINNSQLLPPPPPPPINNSQLIPPPPPPPINNPQLLPPPIGNPQLLPLSLGNLGGNNLKPPPVIKPQINGLGSLSLDEIQEMKKKIEKKKDKKDVFIGQGLNDENAVMNRLMGMKKKSPTMKEQQPYTDIEKTVLLDLWKENKLEGKDILEITPMIPQHPIYKQYIEGIQFVDEKFKTGMTLEDLNIQSNKDNKKKFVLSATEIFDIEKNIKEEKEQALKIKNLLQADHPYHKDMVGKTLREIVAWMQALPAKPNK